MRILSLSVLVAVTACSACSAPTFEHLGDRRADEDTTEAESGKRSKKQKGAASEADTAPAANPLVAFTGGSNIALRWSVIGQGAEGVASYVVSRDGKKIATVTPGFHEDFPEKDGKGYLDGDIVAGATYEYRVQAVDAKGNTTDVGSPLSVVAPADVVEPPTVDFDVSEAPDLADFVTSAKPFIENWYAKAANVLMLPDVKPTWQYTVFFDPSYTGIAEADMAGARIRVNPSWVRENLREAYGMLLHESTHIMENAQVMDGWVTEGIADWSREYILHDRDPKPIGPSDDYRDGYSPGSFFLNWAEETYKAPLVRRLIVAGHEKTFTTGIFVDQTGKTVGQLWEQLTGRKQPTGALRFRDLGNKCVDGGDIFGSGHAWVATCDGSVAQRWFWGPQKPNADDGTIWIEATGGCLDVTGGNTQKGALVQTWACGKSATGQVWKLQSDGTLFSPPTGFCLDAKASVDGTQLRLGDCATAQKFTLPQ